MKFVRVFLKKDGRPDIIIANPLKIMEELAKYPELHQDYYYILSAEEAVTETLVMLYNSKGDPGESIDIIDKYYHCYLGNFPEDDDNFNTLFDFSRNILWAPIE